MHLIIKNHACYNIMSAIESLIATYKRYALVLEKSHILYFLNVQKFQNFHHASMSNFWTCFHLPDDLQPHHPVLVTQPGFSDHPNDFNSDQIGLFQGQSRLSGLQDQSHDFHSHQKIVDESIHQ